MHLRTHLLGDPGGDLGTYVWNLWVFRHELLDHGRIPISTDHLFAYTGGADFSVHNYTPIASAIGATILAPVGVVGAFNTLLLVFISLSGLSVFLLAKRLGLSTMAAWGAGALFVASPVLVARQAAHFSLVIAAPLPLFLWALLRTLDRERIGDAALMGALVAVAYYSDAYYGIYCVLMGVVVVTARFIRIDWPDRVMSRPRVEHCLNAVIALRREPDCLAHRERQAGARAWPSPCQDEHALHAPVRAPARCCCADLARMASCVATGSSRQGGSPGC